MTINNDQYFMQEALKEANKALEENNWPIGCVIELNGEIIARAHNKVYSNLSRLAHAEMQALDAAQSILEKNPSKATLYTTYEPCPMCFGGIILSRINRVVAGIDIDHSGAMFFRKNLPKLFKQDKFHVEFQLGCLSEKCREVFLKGKPTQKLISNGNITL